jgi:hypothetical protein
LTSATWPWASSTVAKRIAAFSRSVVSQLLVQLVAHAARSPPAVGRAQIQVRRDAGVDGLAGLVDRGELERCEMTCGLPALVTRPSWTLCSSRKIADKSSPGRCHRPGSRPAA